MPSVSKRCKDAISHLHNFYLITGNKRYFPKRFEWDISVVQTHFFFLNSNRRAVVFISLEGVEVTGKEGLKLALL
jgi:hypothetical protein